MVRHSRASSTISDTTTASTSNHASHGPVNAQKQLFAGKVSQTSTGTTSEDLLIYVLSLGINTSIIL
jgi:hypothetical protein